MGDFSPDFPCGKNSENDPSTRPYEGGRSDQPSTSTVLKALKQDFPPVPNHHAVVVERAGSGVRRMVPPCGDGGWGVGAFGCSGGQHRVFLGDQYGDERDVE